MRALASKGRLGPLVKEPIRERSRAALLSPLTGQGLTARDEEKESAWGRARDAAQGFSPPPYGHVPSCEGTSHAGRPALPGRSAGPAAWKRVRRFWNEKLCRPATQTDGLHRRCCRGFSGHRAGGLCLDTYQDGKAGTLASSHPDTCHCGGSPTTAASTTTAAGDGATAATLYPPSQDQGGTPPQTADPAQPPEGPQTEGSGTPACTIGPGPVFSSGTVGKLQQQLV